MKHLNLTFFVLLFSYASFAQVGPISGPSTICDGTTGTMTDPTPGGTWTSAYPSIATISTTGGVATGISSGVTTITYTVGAAYATYSVTVVPTPGAITSPSSVCVGSSITVTDPMPGGTWIVTPSTVVMLSGPATLTGVSAGTAALTYTSGAGCIATQIITVNATPSAISGTASVCAGGTTTLSATPSGGMWVSTNPAVAVIGTASGVASGVSYGTATISYNLGTGCSSTTTVTVVPSSATFPVIGGGAFCAGGPGVTVSLAGSTTGSIYQLYNGTTPTGFAVTGTGSSISFGLQTSAGTYSVKANPGTSCETTMTGSVTVGVNPLPTSFLVTGGGTYCSGGSGVHINLSGSQVGVNYQLYLGGAAAGAPIAGTGTTLDFGLFTTAGVYTVVAYNSVTGCSNTMTGSVTVTAGTLPTAYTSSGGGSYCSGGSGIDIMLSGSELGINYSLYNGGTFVATYAGTGSPLDFGMMTLAGSYTIVATDPTTGCSVTTSAALITVNPLPTTFVVTGGGSYCPGGLGVPVGLSGSQTGINYQLYIGASPEGPPTPGTGSAIGFGLQSVTGTYSVVATDVSTGCSSTMGSVTVSVASSVVPSVTITAAPGLTVCVGTIVTYTALPVNGGITPGYDWTVNGIPTGTGDTYAFVPSGGEVVGVRLTSSAACATPDTASASVIMTVDVPTVTATATTATCGGNVTLHAAGASTYSWSPSTGLACTTCADNTFSPAATTTYTVIGTDGTGCTSSATTTVNGNRIFGHITYTGTSTDVFKVWLIQFDPSDSSITAQDSLSSCMDGGIPYYEFDSKPSGDYLVKAKLNGTIPGTSGYIPTYGLSTAHWDSATTVTHTAGADSLHINMIYGTVPAGPGFISGYVVSGAGRTTSGEIPAADMTVYLKDATGAIITYTTTASDGTWSFSSLAEGTYQVAPEAYRYYTTPSAIINLLPGADSAIAVNFKEHTSSRTITPYDNTFVHTVSNTGGPISIYPNPTTGNLTITWGSGANGQAALAVTDMLGREVLQSTVVMNATSGQSHFDLGNLKDGVYMITIRSADLYYAGKLIKQQ